MEVLRIWLSIRQLTKKLKNIKKLRFWGKIMSLQGAYYIVEGELEPESKPDYDISTPFEDWKLFSDDRVAKTDANKNRLIKIESETSNVQEEEEEEEEETIDKVETFLEAARQKFGQNLPQSSWCPSWPIAPEPRGQGLNRWDYFACTSLGPCAEWFLLPSVRPEHIRCAKQMRKFFTGNPMATVGFCSGTGDEFPGVEGHLLRAQIARITQSCWICPSGFFEVNEDEDVEQDQLPQTLYRVEEVEPINLDELLNTSNWLHMRSYILPQGRCTYYKNKQMNEKELWKVLHDPANDGWYDSESIKLWNKHFELKNIHDSAKKVEPKDEQDEDEEEEEEAEDNLEYNDDVVQVGPALLSPIEEDQKYISIGYVGWSKKKATKPKSLSMWYINSCTRVLPTNFAVACAKNSRWPGAYALAKGSDFFNIYIGWGLQSLGTSFTPAEMPPIMSEFLENELDPTTNMNETSDPTVLEESEKQALEEKRLARQKRKETKKNKDADSDDDDDDDDE